MNRFNSPRVAALLAALLLAQPASARDPRLASRLYNPDEVVRIAGRSQVQASIAFAEDERIENIAIGDSTAWQITPNKRANILFVKPLTAKARTNMTVITDRRTYYFDLVAGTASPPLYVLRFTYPEEPKPVEAAALQETITPIGDEPTAAEPAKPAIDPAQLHFGWKAKGKAALLPVRVYDDGKSTYLSWSEATAIPAVQIRNEAGVEGPVNFAVRDDVIIVEGVPPVIILRSGRDMATLQRTQPLRSPAVSQKAEVASAANPEKGE